MTDIIQFTTENITALEALCAANDINAIRATYANCATARKKEDFARWLTRHTSLQQQDVFLFGVAHLGDTSFQAGVQYKALKDACVIDDATVLAAILADTKKLDCSAGRHIPKEQAAQELQPYSALLELLSMASPACTRALLKKLPELVPFGSSCLETEELPMMLLKTLQMTDVPEASSTADQKTNNRHNGLLRYYTVLRQLYQATEQKLCLPGEALSALNTALTPSKDSQAQQETEQLFLSFCRLFLLPAGFTVSFEDLYDFYRIFRGMRTTEESARTRFAEKITAIEKLLSTQLAPLIYGAQTDFKQLFDDFAAPRMFDSSQPTYPMYNFWKLFQTLEFPIEKIWQLTTNPAVRLAADGQLLSTAQDVLVVCSEKKSQHRRI